MVKSPDRLGVRNVLTYTTQCPSVGSNLLVIRRVCGQTWTRVRIKYYNY